jgi:hypothetical protein
VTDHDLTHVCNRILQTFSKNRVLSLEAVFYPYKSVSNTISWSGKHLFIRVSDKLRSAPPYIIEIAAHILLSKLYKKRPERRLRQVYNAYCDNLIPQKTNPPRDYKSEGNYFDLRKRFDYLNNIYFQSGLRVKNIGWSKRISLTRLGFYDRKRDLLVISSVFDERSIPSEVVDYLIFHEMLHIKYPVITRNGRRIIHSRKFRAVEKEFPDFPKIQKWMEKYLRNR